MHVPVLLTEAVAHLNLRAGAPVVDGTVGDGGHATAILEQTVPDGKLLGIDLDPDALKTARECLQRFGSRVMLVQGNFRDAARIVRDARFPAPQGMLLDLGLRSDQLEAGGRGFSFQKDEPLDMRFDPRQELTAAAIVNQSRKEELIRLFRMYGQEPRAAIIAERIVAARRRNPIKTTLDLIALVGGRTGRIHPATRVFQALRIAVNDELEALREGLDGSIETVASHGRIAVISFHSLEDRIVKQTFAAWAAAGRGSVITKRPIVPGDDETSRNPRSRSAKLRVFQTK